MKKKYIWILVIILIVASAVILMKKRKSEIASLPVPVKKSVTVSAVVPKINTIEETKDFIASYYAVNSPIISSKLTGYIKKIYVTDGQNVFKDQLLFKIDDAEIKATIGAKKAAINAAINSIESLKVNLKALENDYKYSKAVYERNLELYKVDALSKEKLDFSKTAMELKLAKFDSTKKTISAKKDELNSLKLQLKSSQNLLNYTSVKSPIEGRIGKILLREGDLIAPNKPVLKIYGKNKRIEFNFPYSMQHEIKVGSKIYLIDNKKAKIDKILPESAKSLLIAISDIDTPLNLPDRANLKVKVVTKTATGTTVPINAILEKKDSNYIFIYENERFSPKKVNILSKNEKYAVISDNITEPVAVGSSDKLSGLFFIKNAKVILNEKI